MHIFIPKFVYIIVVSFNIDDLLLPFANKFGEIQISDTIYHTTKEGLVYITHKNNFSILEKVRNNEIDLNKSYDNLKIMNIPTDDKGCHSSGKKNVLFL